jgi:hypothetical protein
MHPEVRHRGAWADVVSSSPPAMASDRAGIEDQPSTLSMSKLFDGNPPEIDHAM